MLHWRLIFGPILIAALIGILALDTRAGPTAPYLAGLAVLLGVRSAWELVHLLRARSFEPALWLVAACSVAIITANWVPRIWPAASAASADALGRMSDLGPAMLAYSLSVMLVFFYGAVRYRAPGRSMETIGAELLILSYIGVFLSLTAQLRWVGGEALGYLPLGSLIVATKCGDIFAYTFGRLFGKRKLVPRLSPGKTWAGAWGALAGAAAGSWLWFHWGTPWLAPGHTAGDWPWAVLYGVIIGLLGLIGDLCESLIKRDVGQKDAAALLPGFGGLLDLLDSILFAAPAAYLLWLVLPLIA